MLARNFRRNLKATRIKSGHTQESLALKAHLSTSLISMWERGTRVPPLDTLETVARALGVNPVSLIS